MKVLVFGATGQVGREIAARAAPDIAITALGRSDADLCDPAACADAVLAARPDAVINAAAYTAVDKAEGDEATANVVNSQAPGAMAQAAATLGIPIVHISTDYVFDGSGDAPWSPEAPTRPLGVYGATKALGEVAVRDSGAAHAILRTSWVFSSHGSNFVRTMLRLGAERDHLTIVADQIGGPTAATDIAEACLTIARHLSDQAELSGTYHFSGAPDASWADFAREIFTRSGIACDVTDIPTSQYPTPATRPLNSRLDCSSTLSAFGIARPDWRRSLGAVLNELKAIAE